MIHFLTWLIYPMTAIVGGLLVAAACLFRGKVRAARTLLVLCLVWLFVWGTPSVCGRLGYGLEKAYPPLPMDQVPHADVIVLLGGGMGPPRGVCLYPELFGGADRVWHAARLYHAGKAPMIMPSGSAEAGSAVALLKDLGVPASAIVVESRAKNTIENGLFTKQLMRERGYTNALLVTSAFHMRRAEMIFRAVGVKSTPVAADHEATYGRQGDHSCKGGGGWLAIMNDMPNASSLDRSALYLKEYAGYWGDGWRLRRVEGP